MNNLGTFNYNLQFLYNFQMLYILTFYVLGQKLNYCNSSVNNATIVCIEHVPLLQFMVFLLDFPILKILKMTNIKRTTLLI